MRQYELSGSFSTWHPVPGDFVLLKDLDEVMCVQWPPDGRQINPETGDFDEKLVLYDLSPNDMFVVVYVGFRFDGAEREMMLLFDGQLWWFPFV